MRIFALLTLLILSCSVTTAQDIKITEILASNGRAGIDERGKTPDWIELGNTSNQPISLAEYRISDKSNFSKAFVLPDTVLQPGTRILIWASDYPDTVTRPAIIRGAAGEIGHWHSYDSFHFFSLPVNGDFTASIRLNNLNGCEMSEAGLIIREENKPVSRYYGLMAHNDASLWQHFNPTTEPSPANGYFSLNGFLGNLEFPYVWLKIRCIGDTIIAFSSLDNFYWYEGTHYYFPLKNNAGFIGLAFTSGNDTIQSQVGFSDFLLNGRKFDIDELIYTAYNCKPAIHYLSHEIHAPFSLSQSGEKIYLWKPDGSLEDTLSFGKQRRNISYGIDGNGKRAFFYNPTPGKINPQTGEQEITSDPLPLTNSGYFNKPFTLNLKQSADTSVRVYYTTDLSEPTEKSSRFKQSLQITNSATVKFRTFRDGYVPSRVVVRTFIFGEQPPSDNMATIFLTANESDFSGDSTGIWKNIESLREVPVHVELNEGGSEIFSVEMGAKNHGFGGKLKDQKPLDLQLSSPFGDGEITQTVFPEKQATDIKKLILRNASQDWNNTLLRDAFASRLGLDLDLDVQGYRPVRAYFNGKYWGMYQLREKTEESFLASNHNIDDKAVEQIAAVGQPLQGSSAEWSTSVLATLDTNMANDSVYTVLSAPFDLRNFIRYWSLEIFAMNIDWPNNNIKAWRCGKKFPQWRFIVLDNDLSFNAIDWEPDFNVFYYLFNNQQITQSNQPIPSVLSLFRGLMQNNNFKYRFLSRIADFLNTVWSPQITVPLLDSLAAQIEPEIPLHTARWPGSAVDWKNKVERIRLFLKARPDFLRKHVVESFGVTGLTALTVRSSAVNAGSVRVNSLQISSGEFEGVYFRDIPTHISAYPTPDFEFVGWKFADADTLYSKDRDITVTSERDSLVLVAIYRQTEQPSSGSIVINEIMYKAPDSTDTKDWIELYNSDAVEKDVSGWTFKDDDDAHAFTFPAGTIIPPDGFLVVAEDSAAMRKIYDYTFPIIGQFDFGLGRGDAVRIYDAKGALTDSVQYDRRAPWPVEADGNGTSLELIDAQRDNSRPENWKASLIRLGTPGKHNSVYEPQSVYDNTRPDNTILSVYPNPMSEKGYLHAEVPAESVMHLDIYDVLGRLMWNYGGRFPSGEMNVEIPAATLPAGLYRCALYSADGMNNFRCLTINVTR